MNSTSIPLQLRSVLIEEIERGVYGDEGKLPSERALADRFSVSRTSVRECLNTLVKDRLLVRVVGKGTFVAGANIPVSSADTLVNDLAFLIGENIFQFVQPGYNRILIGAEQACRQQGYRLLFHSVTDEETKLALSPGQGIRGCLVAGGLRKKSLERILDWGVPVVLTDLIVDGNTSAVGPDYASGTRQALEHLVSLGHRDVGFVGFPNSEKYQTFWQRLEQLDLRYNPHWVQFLQLPDVEPGILAGYHAMQAMLAGGSLPTALLATNDLVAMGVIEALKMAGIQVPAQVSVIGYDDLGRDQNPPLTTIRSYPEEVGRIAAKMLMEELDGEPSQNRVAVPTKLVARGSTAPPGQRRIS
ncbi:MAG TPA: GntR family transcriptional regulator [Bryobacteraceae bacterium]|nr:GntR family transcriptional regulator [Bryobacteraceae bacterium]